MHLGGKHRGSSRVYGLTMSWIYDRSKQCMTKSPKCQVYKTASVHSSHKRKALGTVLCCQFNKVFEGVQLKAHLISSDPLFSAHSTETVLLKATCNLLLSSHSGHLNIFILLDLSAGFDTTLFFSTASLITGSVQFISINNRTFSHFSSSVLRCPPRFSAWSCPVYPLHVPPS